MPSNYEVKRRKPYKRYGEWTPEKREKFLEALATGISMAGAARSVGLAHSTIYNHKAMDPEFAEEIAKAREAGSDRMEDVLLGMGVNDRQATPLIFLLKARRPHLYRESLSITGGDGGPLQHVHRIERVLIDPRDDPRVIEHQED